MKSLILWLEGFALAIGGPGLFVIAFLDSSFLSLPQINDILVVVMVTQDKTWMLYYAAMATLGSIAGCYVIYFLAEKGGEKFRQRRMRGGNSSRVLALYERHGILALVVAALLPPPTPFKLFVLMAGVARVRPLSFITAVGLARGARYVALGWLAIRYGDRARELMQTRGTEIALWVAVAIVVAAVGWWAFRRYNPAH